MAHFAQFLIEKCDRFMPSENFDGVREGYVYLNGPHGAGYYVDKESLSKARRQSMESSRKEAFA